VTEIVPGHLPDLHVCWLVPSSPPKPVPIRPCSLSQNAIEFGTSVYGVKVGAARTGVLADQPPARQATRTAATARRFTV
jgi:hypothetical protein